MQDHRPTISFMRHHSAFELTSVKPYRQGNIRFVVLFLLIMVVFGNQYAFNNPQALQEPIQHELGINEITYDWLYTAFALPNIFATFIIGFLIDFLGIRIGIVALSLGVVLFQTIVAIGGLQQSYVCMLVGRTLFGIASESLVTAQASFVSYWFVGQELSFALGLAITVPELGNALNSIVTPIIYVKSGNLGVPLFVSVGICTISFICALIAAYLDKKADEEDRMNNVKAVESDATAGQSQQIKCQDVKLLKGSYWLIVTLCMFAVGLYVCFLDNANNLIQHRFCFDQVRAGRIVAITYVVVASCSAPLGLAVDYFGHRRYFTIAGMIVYSIAHLIILVYPQCYSNIQQFGAAWGFFLLGVGYCFYANSIVPSIPLVVKKKILGTAFGIMQMIQSFALAFFPLIAGQLVDQATRRTGLQELGYRHSSLFFFVIGLLGIVFSLGLLFISQKQKRKLDATSKQKMLKMVRQYSNTSESQYRSQKYDQNNVNITSSHKLTSPLLAQQHKKKSSVDPQMMKKLYTQL